MSAGRIVSRKRHGHRDCCPPHGGWPSTYIARHGDKWECLCGRRWRWDADRRTWVQTWPSVLGLRRHQRVA